MREVYCVEYTPRAWDLRSLQFILDVPLYFWRVAMDPQSVRTITTTTTTTTTTTYSLFIYAVPMREVSCVRYTPCTWDPSSLQAILDGPLYYDAR